MTDGANLRAAIDIGSNSVRMLIGAVADGQVAVESQHLRTTRLGRTAKGGRLEAAAVERTLAALTEFAAILTAKAVKQPPIVAATSAVREAADAEDFRARIKAELGWELAILSGKEEAAASYRGAAAVATGAAAVLDVGGGSSELIFRKDGRLLAGSVPVGAVRLASGEIDEAELTSRLSALELLADDCSGYSFVAVGGTITTVAAIKRHLSSYDREAVNGVVVTVEELRAYYMRWQELSPCERLAAEPLLSEREDIIVAGLAIYLALAAVLGFDELIVSDGGILDGLLLQNAE